MLSFRRFLNLVYYTIVRNADEEKRREIDDLLRPPALPRDEAPTWWKGDDDATQSALAAARALGFKPSQMIEVA